MGYLFLRPGFVRESFSLLFGVIIKPTIRFVHSRKDGLPVKLR